MLVLSRKCGEAIVIADDIVVTVLEVKGNRVRLGFVAPDSAPIHRAEVHERIEHNLPADAYPAEALALACGM
jgi:carbon storage regulator